jgi:hypothetical protein
MIEFISHEYFPDDQYTKELCYLQIEPQMRFAYVRKSTKNGGLMWSPISAMVTINGERKYRDSIKFDSSFLREDIIEFLEARSWENKAVKKESHVTDSYKYVTGQPQYATPALPPAQMSFLDECPF